MKHFAVIGCPISQSRSPEIYSDLFKRRGVDAECRRLLVLPCELADIRERTIGLNGFAVTMPHKRAIIGFLDSLDASAEQCGSVNIVKRERSQLIGFNTDGRGLVCALYDMGFDPVGRTVSILGRGGAALAAAHSLRSLGAQVKLLIRSPEPGANELGFDTEPFLGGLSHADLFINASPLGMTGGAGFADFRFLDAVAPTFVYDMVYLSSSETELIKTARALGCRAESGFSMLLRQAELAADIWLGS